MKVYPNPSNKCSVTFLNNCYNKIFHGNNFKLDTINKRILITNKNKEVQSITSIKALPKLLSYSIIGTPTCPETPNIEGVYSTGIMLVINGELSQTITYDAPSMEENNTLTQKFNFTKHLVLDPSTFNLNKKPCIDLIIESIHVDFKNSRDLFEKISLLVDVY